MSTNAFARSRPRVRQQRISRTHSCDHPRFLQLVNELSRLNELKKKKQSDEIASEQQQPPQSQQQNTSCTEQACLTVNNTSTEHQANTSTACSSSTGSGSSTSGSSSDSSPTGNHITDAQPGRAHLNDTNNGVHCSSGHHAQRQLNISHPTTSSVQNPSNCGAPLTNNMCTPIHVTTRRTNNSTADPANLCQCPTNYCCPATTTTPAPVCYRSLDNTNQSSSITTALNANSHDYYNRLQNNISLNASNVCANQGQHRSQHYNNHNHHHTMAQQQQQQHNHHQPRDQPNLLAHHLIQFGNIPMHHNHHHHLQQQQQPQQSTVRCADKSSSSSLPTNTPFGYSKQGLVEQNGPDFSNNNINSSGSSSSNNNINSSSSDLRQDENRSKRKRSSNDPPGHLKKCASGTSSANSSSASSSANSASCCAVNSKRHKSSPEASRPLSPSFTKCPICLLDCMDRDPSFTNTCFHLFCFVCIENWTKNKATCPLCRTKFTKIIYNIRSATSFDEKIVSPVRRDDDDGYIADRLMIEHLSSLNSNSSSSSRNNDDVQFLFENFRNTEVLTIPQYFVNHIDPRQEGHLHSFTPATTQPTADFNSNVPHSTFNPTNYPMASNYILFQPNRINSPTITAAITSAYNPSTGLTSMNNDASLRRGSRGGRYIYSRNLEPPSIETGGPGTRMSSRASTASSGASQPVVTLERHHHHQPHQHQRVDHQHHHQHSQHRVAMLDIIPSRSQRAVQPQAHIQTPYAMQPRYHGPSAYARRPYLNSQVEHQQQILDTLYRQMPDI